MLLWLRTRTFSSNRFEANFTHLLCHLGFPGGSVGKESACSAGDLGSIPGSGRSAVRRKWQPSLVFFPGEFHGQRSLVGHCPWDNKESDTTE